MLSTYHLLDYVEFNVYVVQLLISMTRLSQLNNLIMMVFKGFKNSSWRFSC